LDSNNRSYHIFSFTMPHSDSASNAIQNQSKGLSSAITQLYDHFMNFRYSYALCLTAAGIFTASYYFYKTETKSKAKSYLSLKGKKGMADKQNEAGTGEGGKHGNDEISHKGIVIYLYCRGFLQ